MRRGSGGRSRPPVGSRGKAPGGGLGATPPEAEGFLQFRHLKLALKCIQTQLCLCIFCLFRTVVDYTCSNVKASNNSLYTKTESENFSYPNRTTEVKNVVGTLNWIPALTSTSLDPEAERVCPIQGTGHTIIHRNNPHLFINTLT